MERDMPKPPIAPIDEMEGLLDVLEHNRLELVEAIASSDKGYNDKDMEKLALHGSAIQSVRDAIDFRKKFDGK
jgi:hypothetical protein